MVLYSFAGNAEDGGYPIGDLVAVKGTLYGTTQTGCTVCTDLGRCGTVFSLDPATGAGTVLHLFDVGADGDYPWAGLVAVKGMLYGTTAGGGPHSGCESYQYYTGCGTVFALDPATGTETVVYASCGQESCKDGSHPYARLLDVKGTLYGTTLLGGHCKADRKDGCGTVFSLDPATGA
ncbi:MAG TPA: choice-of-anchor tandem repeat GloVer-containing protein [Rhizomicrobium sp.]|nr:choice-of-anchor tandem repeat GloVer-containing protein [Rhizomicrobium sp.]